MLRDKPTTLWTVPKEDGSTAECLMRFVPMGVEIEIVSDGWPICSRIFSVGHAALNVECRGNEVLIEESVIYI
jgi:hypothetical protein